MWEWRKIPELSQWRQNWKKSFRSWRVTTSHNLTVDIAKFGDFCKSPDCEISGFMCEPHPAFSLYFRLFAPMLRNVNSQVTLQGTQHSCLHCCKIHFKVSSRLFKTPYLAVLENGKLNFAPLWHSGTCISLWWNKASLQTIWLAKAFSINVLVRNPPWQKQCTNLRSASNSIISLQALY